MEGIAAASAILGIAGLGLHVYETLSEFVGKAVGAHLCIVFLKTDIRITWVAIKKLHQLLEEDQKTKAMEEQILMTNRFPRHGALFSSVS